MQKLSLLLQQKKYAGEKILFLLQIFSTMSTNFAVLTFFVPLIKSWNTIYENWKCQVYVTKFVKLKYCFYTDSNPSQRNGLIAKVHSQHAVVSRN